MARDRPLSAAAPIVLAVLALGALVVLLPSALERMLKPAPAMEAAPVAHSPDDVKAFVDDALKNRTVLGRETGKDGESFVTIEVPPNVLATTEAEALRHAAGERGLEAYAVDVDGLDAETRFYGGRLLASVRFVPTVPQIVSVPPEMRPALVALVVTGLDGELPSSLQHPSIPITIAIEAFRPASLALAEAAAQASAEVLVAATDHGSAESQWKAVPYASGFLLAAEGAVPPLADSFQVVLAPHPLTGPFRTVVAQWGAPERDTRTALRRALWLASRSGSAALVVRADDPLLPQVMRTLAATEDVRPVLVSEAARPKEVRGPPREDVATAPPGG